MSKLLIVESPTKAKTIGRMLGKDYKIIASMGHVRDLPEHAFGIDIEHGFAPQYTDTPRSRQVLRDLRLAAKGADEIYLATDPDREGEAIAWHLRNALQSVNGKAPYHRVTFHEITRSAIEQAMLHKGEIDQNLVDAQQARRVLDRIVGYQVSPLLWRRLGKGSSAGRVQSAALRLVVERERAITGFKPEEYWNFSALFRTGKGVDFQTKLTKIDGKDFRIDGEKPARELEAAVRGGSTPRIGAVNRAERRRNPYPPFTTSTLQQTANQLLHYSATSTMRVAQQLYEGIDLGSGSVGLITYMRTDSVTIAKEAQVTAAEFIRRTFGDEYAPAKFNFYKNKAAAQEAHEAIRPTDVNRTPEMVADKLDAQQLKLYTLIWKRFVASQMSAAKQEVISVDVEIEGSDRRSYDFHAAATQTLFPGFLKLNGEEKADKTEKDENRPELLRSLSVGENAQIVSLDSDKKFTEPPPRFTEASLIKLLEENGIGRPSTYATILKTIQDRGYVGKEQNKLHPTELGFTVNDYLIEKLPELFDINFTAQMEQQLDDVEAGSVQWVAMMSEFYARFLPWLEAAKNSGAPETKQSDEILSLFDTIQFAPPKKIGRRTFDDKKFVDSIREKYAEKPQISAKQYQALLVIAARYLGQIDLNSGKISPELSEALREAESAIKAKELQEQERSAATGGIDYDAIFAALDKIEFPAPKTGKYGFDEGKFIQSLKRQYVSGKALSEKQLAVLKRSLVKHRDQLSGLDAVYASLGLDAEPVAVQEKASAAENSAGSPIAGLLAKLAEVREWAPPVKRGRFSFDDHNFYQSLAKQFKEKRALSDKQVAALEKLAAKYNTAGKAEKNEA